MIKYIVLIILSISLFYSSFCQTENKTNLNFGFEKMSKKNNLWFNWGTAGYTLRVDSSEKHTGDASMLIEQRGNKANQSYGCCALSIPSKFEGSQIEVRAYMKLQNVTNGPIGLLLRIDNDRGTLKFENMEKENIQGTSDWKLYSVKLPLPEDAETIYIGALLSGTGKLWVDDFELLIDGVDISKAQPKKQEVFKADSDTSFDKGSKIATINLTSSKIEDLVILGKVWGFLKYHHPAIAKGDYNWDYELFRIMPKIIQSKNNEERNEILSKWVLKLGEVKKDTTHKIINAIVKLKPDLDWITNKSVLGEELTSQLMQIREAARDTKQYYIGFEPSFGNPQFKNEKTYNYFLRKPDIGYQLLSLYRYWNIIQYYFPYKYLIDENWDDVLTEFVPKFVNTTNELDYRLTVLALIAKIHDTHANIFGNEEVLRSMQGNNYAPIEVKFIENKAVVTGYLNKLLGAKSGLKKGDIILTVNNKNIKEIIKEKLSTTPASNYPTQLRDIANNLLRTNDTTLKITYQREKLITSLYVKCFSLKNSHLFAEYYKKDTCFKLLTPEIAYIFPGSIKNNYLPEIMDKVQNTKGLIIDMRCYPSQFIVFRLGEYLMPEPISFVKITKASSKNPGLFIFKDEFKVGKTNKDYYKGKVIIIINEITQSQAEYTTMAFRVAPKAKVIGSTTAGADGNVSEIFLPGGIKTMISGTGIYYPNGKETQRIGIVPDIEVRPTIKGIYEGKDELLEKAIEIINEK